MPAGGPVLGGDRAWPTRTSGSPAPPRRCRRPPAHGVGGGVPPGRARPNRRPRNQSANDTTGLKWAPETGPNIKMITNSPSAVAAAFSSSSSPRRRATAAAAAIPEPITTAARNALPRNSASSRRRSGAGCTGHAPILTRKISSVKIESMNIERTLELARRAAVHAALADPRGCRSPTRCWQRRVPVRAGAPSGVPSNLLAHHLHVLEQAGVITRRRSEGDRRRTYLRLIPGALPAGRRRREPAGTARVLFVCTANSARSTWPPRCGAGPAPSRRHRPEPTPAAHRPARPPPPRATASRCRTRPAPLSSARDGDLIITVCDRAHEELKRCALVGS